MQAFTTHPEVVRVLGKGETKSSVEFIHGLHAQLWVHPPERYGTLCSTPPAPKTTTCACASWP